MPRLVGRAFHVTTNAALSSIERDGEIRPSTSGVYPFQYPQSGQSFFRLRGCASVFDLRRVPNGQIEQSLWKYYFLNPFDGNQPCFLTLSSRAASRLEPWTAWEQKRDYSQMVIPYVEAGHLGPISVGDIDRVLLVTVIPMPPDLTTLQGICRLNRDIVR
ncbi:MAG: hypothetical protein HYY93_15075 [Planctomycetes bacterium]|nr:hypothetical protein [Planctomycetota bacterium]